jgi:hypothetical protein
MKHPLISVYGRNTLQGSFPLVLVVGREPNDDLPMGETVGPYDFEKAPHCQFWNTAYKIVAATMFISVRELKELCKEHGSSILAFADASPFTISFNTRDKNEIRNRFGPEDYVSHAQGITSQEVFKRVNLVILSGLEDGRYKEAVQTIKSGCKSGIAVVETPFLTWMRKGRWQEIWARFTREDKGLIRSIYDNWSKD